MKYIVTVNGEKYEVEVERVIKGASSLTRGAVAASRTEEVRVSASQPVVREEIVAPVVKEETKQTIAAPVAAVSVTGSGNVVVSPMPGSILDVNVAVGDQVTEGDVVCILEAMKMENEITSEFTGTVAAIKVKKGDTVDTDTVLIEIK